MQILTDLLWTTLVTAGGFEQRTTYIQSRYLTHLGNSLNSRLTWLKIFTAEQLRIHCVKNLQLTINYNKKNHRTWWWGVGVFEKKWKILPICPKWIKVTDHGNGEGRMGDGGEGEDKMKIFANMSKMDESYRASYGGRGWWKNEKFSQQFPKCIKVTEVGRKGGGEGKI